MKTNLRHETGDKLESVEIVTERTFECGRPDDCMSTPGPDCASCIMRCANPYAHSSLQSGTKSFEDWTGTPEGSMALTVVVRCDSFAAATGALRAAFNAGSRHQVRQSPGVDAIAAERERQISAEGWTPDHDDEHDEGEMARAAAAYAEMAAMQVAGEDAEFFMTRPRPNWPWDVSWWKPKDQRRNLVRAGALIAAEIDRLDRNEKYLDTIAAHSRTVAGDKPNGGEA